jgi:hypothetical protein
MSTPGAVRIAVNLRADHGRDSYRSHPRPLNAMPIARRPLESTGVHGVVSLDEFILCCNRRGTQTRPCSLWSGNS